MQGILKRFGMLPSTIAFYREARRRPNFSWRELAHSCVYGRWPYLCIGLAIGRHRLLRVLEPLAALASWRWTREPGGPPQKRAAQPPNEIEPVDPAVLRKRRTAETYHGKVLLPEAARRPYEVPIR